MTGFEYTLQCAVLVLLVVAIPFTIRLERGLSGLRRDRGAMDGSARGLGEAATAAEATLRRMRITTDEGLRQISERCLAGEKLRDDLRYLIERADSLADRLDGLVRQVRPIVAEPVVPIRAEAAAPPEAPARSQAERDLIRALKLAR
ncbi:DUF6468 domain-containing protein [Plastoroseomonas arctica]|uniref:DUF6468 domain-containing protein n=1 Tax=Plastoroseomonas arctica TaxID=1509237 RepID=A0AAF1JZV3_9PROT|nr:DUF6468 domain-containing protein [Plastoroseomonas arctica]MBR0657577.1 hypothetical protein [Plastoroseomonas arctica]